MNGYAFHTRDMLSVAVAFLAIAVDIGLARLGYGLLLPAIRADIGGSYGLYGVIGAVHLAGYLGGTLIGARFIRNRARLPRVIAGAHIVVAAGLTWSAAAHDAVTLCAARVLLGVASGIGIVAVVTDALERTPSARRGLVSSIAWSGIGIAVIVSAPAGHWSIVDAVRWRAVSIDFAAAALLTALAAAALRPLPATSNGPTLSERPFHWRDLATWRYLAFVGGYTCFGIAYISYATFAVAAFAARGITGATLTDVWFGYGAAAVLGSIAVGWILGSRWHRFALAAPLLAGAAGCTLSVLDGTLAAIAGAFAVGSSLAATPGVASAFARERSDTATAAQAFAAVTACFGLGQIIGPLISGALADGFGLRAPALIGATVFAIGALLALVDATRHQPRRSRVVTPPP